MSRFGIVARFPLGVFQGHAKGKGAPMPSVSRLHSALVCAASKGTDAVERDGDLRASDASLRALRWLEENPPIGIAVPHSRPVSVDRQTRSYRNEGVLNGYKDRVMPRRISRSTAVNGPFGWIWADVPQEVADIVGRLCEDVPVLGEADSPVILEAGLVEPTLQLNPAAGELSPRGMAVSVPARGRVDVLEEAYEAANPQKHPTMARDAFKQTESVSPSPVPTGGLAELRYEHVLEEPVRLPWSEALILPSPVGIPVGERVRWCVTLHRTLAKLAPSILPSSITGKYPKGTALPANRVALQFVPGALTGLWDGPGAFVVMLPTGMSSQDKGTLLGLLARPLTLFRGDQRVRLRLERSVSTDQFWPSPPAGVRRRWMPEPAMVAEVRRQKRGADMRRWTLDDTVCVAIGMVFRDELAVPGRDYAAMTAEVRSRGVQVEAAHVVADSHVDRYAHKVPDGMVVQPMSALVSLGALAGDRSLLAVGQSRHLGGGLLLPVDEPEPPVEAGHASR